MVSDKAKSASGDDKKKLTIAAADIGYNLGVVRLKDARAQKTDAARWKAALDTFRSSAEFGQSALGGGRSDADILKNYFGVALTTADQRLLPKARTPSPDDIKTVFALFASKIDSKTYAYREQADVADCVARLATGATFDSDLEQCLTFFH